MVSAGAFSVRAGAELICHRIAATSLVGSGAGGMLSLSCDEHVADKLLDLVADSRMAVAVVNGPGQVVVSGPLAGLRKIEQIADTIGVTAVRLLAPVAFHNREMETVRVEVLRRIRDIPQCPFTVPVYSPILGRFYRDSDRLAELLSLHLVTPVRFGDATARMHDAGARIFVEVGAGGALCGLAKVAFPGITTLVPLSGKHEASTLARAAAFLHVPGSSGQSAEVAAVSLARARMAEVPREPEPLIAAQPQAPDPAGEPAPEDSFRAGLLTQIQVIYAQALEYPEEVFTQDARLEADLGVDSVKQTELFIRVRDHFGLPADPDGARASDYETVGAVVDWVEVRMAETLTRAR